LSGVPRSVPQGPNGNEDAAALAMLHDAADAEVVVQETEGSPDLAVVAAGVQIVDQNVIGTLKRASADEGERAKRVVAGVVDAHTVCRAFPILKLAMTGEATATWGNLARTGPLSRHRSASDRTEEAGIGRA